MSKAARKKRVALRRDGLGELQDNFIRGFVSTGLLVATGGQADRRGIVRAALQGGTALASAGLVVGAVRRGSLAAAVAAVAAGAAGLYAIGRVTHAHTASPDG